VSRFGRRNNLAIKLFRPSQTGYGVFIQQLVHLLNELNEIDRRSGCS
jgi:hypothetical protein